MGMWLLAQELFTGSWSELHTEKLLLAALTLAAASRGVQVPKETSENILTEILQGREGVPADLWHSHLEEI